MRIRAFLLPTTLLTAAIAPGACHAPEAGESGPTPVEAAVDPASGPSNGATVALTEDDERLVVVNRESGTLSVFALEAEGDLPSMEKVGEVAVGGEAWQLALHPNGESAFVLARGSQTLVRVGGLHGKPEKREEVAVGAEPTGLALSPLGTTAYVGNWVDGTISVIDTKTMKVTRTIDLNVALAGSGLLGNVAARPALAHPRSLAITNDGDKDEVDETLWVTEFYAQQKTPVLPDGSNADTAKVGVLYRIPLATAAPSVVELPALTDMGFRDHNGNVAGCFPNQLLSLTLKDDRAFVTSVCASPKGPTGPFAGPPAAICATDAECPGGGVGTCVATKCTTNCTADAQCGANEGVCVANVCAANTADVKTTSAPALTIVNAGTGVVEGSVNLAKAFVDAYVARGVPDDSSRRLPLMPFGVAFVPGSSTAYVAANGADALFRFDVAAPGSGTLVENAGHTNAMFVDLSTPVLDATRIGRLPSGVAVTHREHGAAARARRYAFVNNESTRNVTAVDLTDQEIAGIAQGTPAIVRSTAMPESEDLLERNEGLYFFNSGVGRWSLKGQAWLACQSCHVDGLSDNVTWFFPRGPRQPQSLDGTYSKTDPNDIRANNWTGIQDEIADHEMGAIRGTAAGVGAIVSAPGLKSEARIAIDKLGQAGLNGSAIAAADPSNPASLPAACVNDDWRRVRSHVRNIRSPNKPTTLDGAQVERGRALFEAGHCQGCHGGSKWTYARVFYTPDPTNKVNTALKTSSWTDSVEAAGFPQQLLPTKVPSAQTMRYNGKAPANLDSLTCLLRPVGTFGVAEPEVGIAELRKDMKTVAQGNEETGSGYSPPSLLGLVMGAPYFHAGQARTLEAVFSPTFAAHSEALAPGFLDAGDRATNVRDLVSFLLSIDTSTPALPTPALGPEGGDFCAAPAP